MKTKLHNYYVLCGKCNKKYKWINFGLFIEHLIKCQLDDDDWQEYLRK